MEFMNHINISFFIIIGSCITRGRYAKRVPQDDNFYQRAIRMSQVKSNREDRKIDGYQALWDELNELLFQLPELSNIEPKLELVCPILKDYYGNLNLLFIINY